MAPDGDTFSDIPPQATPQTGQRPSSPRTGCATYTDVQVLSALRMMECDRAPSHMQARPLFTEACWQVGHVLCGTNTLTIPHPSRRVRHGALAVLGQCNSFEERHDLASYAMCIASSAERVACGTSRKLTQ